MKKLFKNWNLFEIILLFAGIVVVAICFVFTTPKDWLSFFASVLGVVSVMLVSKGIFFAPVLGVIYNVIYIILSIGQAYYGEAIIYAFIMTPIEILSIINWIRNKKQDNTVSINKISKKEYIYLFVATIVLTVGFYFILWALNTAELVVSTISLVTSAIATYLLLRRSSYYAIGFMLNDIILIVLWAIATAVNGVELLPMVISFGVFLVNDIYGFVRWKKQEKKQDTSQTQNKELV